MRKIQLFIAMSVDGYIADRNGGVGWLSGHGEEETLDSYTEFIKGVDTVVMGWNTYHQIVTELSPDEWVYRDLTTYVVTSRREQTSNEKIFFTGETPAQLVRRLREEEGKAIWICGGANVVQQLVKEDLIDEYYITIIPTILGSGVRLFGTADHEIPLRLQKIQTYDGMTDFVFSKRS